MNDKALSRRMPAFYQRVRRITPPLPPPQSPSMWTRSVVIGIAKARCAFCHGAGLLPILRGTAVPCNCGFRAVFRICHQRYRECEALAAHTNGVGLEHGGGPTGYRLYSRKREEFSADFSLVARRELDAPDYAIFRCYFLGTADWHACCSKLKVDRGTFFHRVYTIMQLLGRTYAELLPYPLYPVAGYFAGVQSSGQDALPFEVDVEQSVSSNLPQWAGQQVSSYYR